MGKIELEKLNNTRDLGGIVLPDGCIRQGRLIRSGQLHDASEADLEWLRDNVSVVVDFRSAAESDEAPDPVIEGVEILHYPIVEDIAAGVSRDSKSDEEAYELLATDPDSAMGYMCVLYEGFVLSEVSRRGYEAFVRKVFENRDKAILWHCTVGKDRAGFGTVILLEMLGADRETIISDYLATNVYIEQDIEAMVRFFFGDIGAVNSTTETALRNLFGARKEYLEAAYGKVEELYGSFSAFIRDGLHVSDEEIEAWKKDIVVKA